MKAGRPTTLVSVTNHVLMNYLARKGWTKNQIRDFIGYTRHGYRTIYYHWSGECSCVQYLQEGVVDEAEVLDAVRVAASLASGYLVPGLVDHAA